jgi:hypothetical protein
VAYIKGKGITGPIELEFEGKLQIKENILSDWSGYGISATINIMPREMALNRVYPNPFNPITSISYTLSNTKLP